MARNEVRIIGGKWKGRKLKFPRHPNLRPTLGRSRETLFNWLAPYLADARCLDLFAGSGALGFEALSRGAASVVLVERNRAAIAALHDNAATLGAGAAQVVSSDAAHFLARSHTTPFDVVLLDPPFDTSLLERTLQGLRDGAHLAPGALVYFETRRNQPFAHDGYSVHREAHAGDTHFGLLSAP